MANITDNMTPVLNVWNNEIVMLPLENALVITQARTMKLDDFDLLGIENADYTELTEELDLPELTGNETRDYFVKRCNESSGYGTPVLSDKGYEQLFDVLLDAGFNIRTMMEQLARIINTWHEGTPEYILDDLDIDYSDMSDDDKLWAAINAIHDNDHMSYNAHYEANGENTILYSQG